MPHGFRGEQTLMRIFVGERDKCRGGPRRGSPSFRRWWTTSEATISLERPCRAGSRASARIAGCTPRRYSVSPYDLPVVVEVVATDAKIREALPDLDEMIDGGLITLERAEVILYRPHDVPEDERWRHRIGGLEPGDR